MGITCGRISNSRSNALTGAGLRRLHDSAEYPLARRSAACSDDPAHDQENRDLHLSLLAEGH